MAPGLASLTVVFDLDGTLVDTAPDLVNALNHVFRREGIPELQLADAKTLIGGGMRPFIERGLQREGRACPASEIDALFRDLLTHYAEHIAVQSRVFPGVGDALAELTARGCKLAVCTNKLEWLSVRLLDALGLSPLFNAICGADTFGVPKPDPRALAGTVAKAGGDIRRALMVGDSATDIAAARAAGMPVIAVDFGYTEVPVARLSPDRIVSHYSELVPAVGGLWAHHPHA